MNDYRWEDIYLGLTHDFSASFTEEMMEQFAIISGDCNPLHMDEVYAQNHGFPTRVVFGLLSASLYSRLVGVYMPGRSGLLHGLDIDLNAPCYPGEILRVEGTVSFMNDAYKRFEVRARIRKSDRSTVSRSTLRVGFHE